MVNIKILRAERTMRTLIPLLVIVALLTIIVIRSDAPEPVDVEGSRVRTFVVTVVRPLNAAETMDDIEDSRLCLMYGSLNPWEEAGPELIITDNTERVVGVIEVGQGMWKTHGEGASCVVRAEVSLTDAPFYTFSVANVYKRTVSRTNLANADWSYEIITDTQ
jgi:hypothetical protein